MKRACVIVVLGLLLGCIPLSARAAQIVTGGKSALLMETVTGTVLYESNAREALPPASVTKVMTMLLIMEALDSGRIRWEDPVTASAEAAGKGGSQVYLKEGERMTVRDMFKAIAVSSANDCACAMAELIAGSEAAFVEKMNARAAELGMTDTCFVNCTGLDDSPEAREHRTSARDIALMSRQLLLHHPGIREFTTIWMDSVRDGAFGLSNTNKMIRFYDGATGLKTGFTAAAGYCLSASARREGMELIAVVMGAESSKERFQSCKSMLDHGFAGYALVRPDLCDAAPVPVTLGKTPQAVPRMAEDPAVLVPREEKDSLRLDIRLPEHLTAPVEAGQPLGTMTVSAGEQVLKTVPLVAAEGVARLGFGDIFLRVLRRAAMAKPV